MKLKSLIFVLLNSIIVLSSCTRYPDVKNDIDKKVKAFLEENENNWQDMNVSSSDGKTLYNIIVENGYTEAVEIGTSTGHSAIWIAWALSKTGGKLITIEIDKKRYLEAKANFKKAGVSDYIDVQLGDAHDIIPNLKGKYDFVFCDADRIWYKNYFIEMDPKLKKGACFVAHNISGKTNGIKSFLDHIESIKNYKTHINKDSRAGISVSYKK